jgi:hypothetical protein
MGGASGNSVLLGQNGHKEAVYDKEGKLVTNCSNQGSFNFFHPVLRPLGHFEADTLPWLKSGNCTNDSTSYNERLKAWEKDFKKGLTVAIKNKDNLNILGSVTDKDIESSKTLQMFVDSLQSESVELKAENVSKVVEVISKRITQYIEEIVNESKGK